MPREFFSSPMQFIIVAHTLRWKYLKRSLNSTILNTWNLIYFNPLYARLVFNIISVVWLHDYVEKRKNRFVTNRNNQQTYANVWLNLKNIVFKTPKQEIAFQNLSHVRLRVSQRLSVNEIPFYSLASTHISIVSI